MERLHPMKRTNDGLPLYLFTQGYELRMRKGTSLCKGTKYSRRVQSSWAAIKVSEGGV